LVTMSTPEQRMWRRSVDFQARRHKKGHLQVYKLPAWDGGGLYEVAGTNEKYKQGSPRPSGGADRGRRVPGAHPHPWNLGARQHSGFSNSAAQEDGNWAQSTLQHTVPSAGCCPTARAVEGVGEGTAFSTVFFLLAAASSRASCAAARPCCRTTRSARHSISTWRGTSEAIDPRWSARKVRCASSFPSPTNGASGGAAISARPTACISRWPCRNSALGAEARLSPPLAAQPVGD
jgi:hypothetical protein